MKLYAFNWKKKINNKKSLQKDMRNADREKGRNESNVDQIIFVSSLYDFAILLIPIPGWYSHQWQLYAMHLEW